MGDKKLFAITDMISGHSLGLFAAETSAGALDAMAREAGHADYVAMEAVAPATEDELEIDELEVTPVAWTEMDSHRSDLDPGAHFEAAEAYIMDLGDTDYAVAAVDLATGEIYCRVVYGGRELAEESAVSLDDARARAEAILMAAAANDDRVIISKALGFHAQDIARELGATMATFMGRGRYILHGRDGDFRWIADNADGVGEDEDGFEEAWAGGESQ